LNKLIIIRHINLVSGTSLKAYWKLGTSFSSSPQTEANVASTVAGSSSSDLGTNADMDIYNQPTQVTSGTPTNLGNANLFDGVASTSGDWGRPGTNANKSQWNFMHNTTSVFTLNFWAKFPDGEPDANEYFWDEAEATDSIPSFQLRAQSGMTYRTIISNSTGNYPVIATDSNKIPIPTDDAWHMYTVTWDYLNTPNYTGRVDANTSGTYYKTQNKSSNVAVDTDADYAPYFMRSGYQAGGGTGGTYGFTNGNVCEVAIWNRVLTNAEITKLYQSGAGLQLATGTPVWKEKGTA